jgi:hypothetical protein
MYSIFYRKNVVKMMVLILGFQGSKMVANLLLSNARKAAVWNPQA